MRRSTWSSLLLELAFFGAILSSCSKADDNQAQAPATSRPIQVLRGEITPSASPTVPKGSCWALGMTNVVGQVYSNAVAEQARQSSGAQTVQIVKVGDGSAAAADGNRLTLEVNERDTIVDARCG